MKKSKKLFQHLKNLAIIIILNSLLFLNSCDTSEPVGETLSLIVEDVSCTGVWLKLNSEVNGDFILTRNHKEAEEIKLSGIDNIIYNDSLQPNTTYNYQVSSIKSQVSSNKITAVTMDTTNSNYTWEKLYFGNIGSSQLNDIWIFDENNIWVVGEIMIKEGTEDHQEYGFVRWDGSQWKVFKLTAERANGGSFNPGPRGIFAFTENDIWFASGSIVHWDGEKLTFEFSRLDLARDDQGIEKLWGSSPNDIYGVGNNGTLIHYDGSKWNQLDSGTELDIQDIWGDYDVDSGKWEILAVASNHLSGYEREIIKIEGDKLRSIPNNPLTSTISSTWFISSRKYLIGGSGIYSKVQIDRTNWKKENTINKYYTYRIQGNFINDIVAVGGFGDLQHYNGFNWRSHYTTTQIEGNYRSVAVKGNIVVAVGQHNAQAVITIGRR